MRFGSVCSGIEAASVAWHPLGWQAAFLSEIDKFPRAVLSARWPDAPLHGDFTTIKANDYESIDLLVGGTPCQSFSVAGLRGGLGDDRGNLALEYLRLAGRLRPKWLVWENVPGVLSSNGGRDFGSILGGLVELGYGFAYRVLDAQFFGVPQRRRRVFVVGHLGDWRRAAAVLFEPESLRRDSPPSRQAGQGTAPTIASRPTGGGGLGTDFDCDGGLIARPLLGKENMSHDETQDTLIARCVTAREGQRQDWETETLIAHSLKADGFDASEDGTGRGTPLVTHALDSFSAGRMTEDGTGRGCPIVPVAFAIQERAVSENLENGPQGKGYQAEGAYTLEARNKVQAVAFNITPSNSNKDYNARQSERAQAITQSGNRPSARGGDLIAASTVRRLTPRECERLQGFPDNYTLIEYRGKAAADGPRYKALGNSMAVPVMRWIGERINLVEQAA